MDTLTYGYLPLIYQLGKDWWIVFWMDLGLAVAVFFPLLFFIRESPKYLLSVGKFE